uniref:C3H1-type domain-containing protein n=1 Tax=Panagrolaimus sp. ES5 TaxID=591445 RepID=A0AC34EZK3_9BILA
MSEDCDTAKRLIAQLLQFTLPGQIELPLNWVNGPEKVDEDTVPSVIDDADNVMDNNQIKNDIVKVASSQDENLEDGELPDDDDEEEGGEDGEIMEKENDTLASSPNTSFDSSEAGYNGSVNDNKQKSVSKSAKHEAKRQKYGHLICKFFREGKCQKGVSCFYSHNAADSHRVPQLCKGYITGKCRKAFQCNFWHGEHPCKDFHFGRCIVPKCRFSHLPLDDYTRPVFEKALKDEEEAAISANAIPLSSAFSSSQNIPVNCPPTFPPPSFSKSANPVMHTNPNSLLYNKNAVRKSVAPYNKKLPKSKTISSASHPKVTVDSLLSDIAFSLPNLRQCC